MISMEYRSFEATHEVHHTASRSKQRNRSKIHIIIDQRKAILFGLLNQIRLSRDLKTFKTR